MRKRNLSDPHMDAFFNLMAPLVDRLASRWADEHEYEDIREYAAVIEKKMPTDFTFLQITKRPFGFKFSGPDNLVRHIRCKRNTVVM